MKMTKEKSDAYVLLNCYIIASRLSYKAANGVCMLAPIDKFQVWNLRHWCSLLEISFNREDWEGNAHCKSNWDKVWFTHKGVEFFELVEKENN